LVPPTVQEAVTRAMRRQRKLRVANNKNKGKNTICNIVVDEMAIRQQLLFNNNRFYGIVEFSADHSEDIENVPLVKEALVFMAVRINDS
jgi:hypothetical protein